VGRRQVFFSLLNGPDSWIVLQETKTDLKCLFIGCFHHLAGHLTELFDRRYSPCRTQSPSSEIYRLASLLAGIPECELIFPNGIDKVEEEITGINDQIRHHLNTSAYRLVALPGRLYGNQPCDHILSKMNSSHHLAVVVTDVDRGAGSGTRCCDLQQVSVEILTWRITIMLNSSLLLM